MSEKNTKKAAPVRDLSVKQGFKISRFLVSWEMVLVYILILINLVLMISRTNLYFSQGTIQSIMQSGMDVCPLVLGMIFILMLGDIDVSVEKEKYALCGAFNGFLIAECICNDYVYVVPGIFKIIKSFQAFTRLWAFGCLYLFHNQKSEGNCIGRFPHVHSI